MLNLQQVGDQGHQAPSYTDPSTTDPSYTDPSYGQPNDHGQRQEEVQVEQLVKVCVTGDHVQVWDESQPFAWLAPVGGYAPTPSGEPSALAPYLAK